MKTAACVVRATTGESGVVARRFGAETLLVPVCSGVGDLDSVYTLNEVGTTVWEAIAEPTPLDDLLDVIAREYDIGIEEVRRDVDAFLADLAQLGLVQITGTEL